jgi:hypothetical protein
MFQGKHQKAVENLCLKESPLIFIDEVAGFSLKFCSEGSRLSLDVIIVVSRMTRGTQTNDCG